MNIFSELFYSFWGVKKYPEFLKNKKGKVFGYVIVVVLIYSIIAQLMTIPATNSFVKEAREMLLEFPDFQIESGYMEIEESFTYDDDLNLVMLESEYGSYIREYTTADWYATLEYYDFVVISDATTLLLKNNGSIDIYDYPVDFSFSRDTVYSWIDYAYPIIIIYLVFAFIFSVIGYFFTALIVALAGMIICSFMKQKLTFGQLYLLALYAKTLPLLVKGLLNLLSIDIFGFSILSFAVSCVYLGFAIHHMDQLDEEKNKVNEPIIF